MLGGDFSILLDVTSSVAGVVDCSGNPTYQGEIFNPRLTHASGANPTGYCGVPVGVDGSGVPTNIFPSSGPSAISPVAARLAGLFPAPNGDINGSNYLVDPKKSLNQNNFDIRVDHRVSGKDNF